MAFSGCSGHQPGSGDRDLLPSVGPEETPAWVSAHQHRAGQGTAGGPGGLLAGTRNQLHMVTWSLGISLVHSLGLVLQWAELMVHLAWAQPGHPPTTPHPAHDDSGPGSFPVHVG